MEAFGTLTNCCCGRADREDVVDILHVSKTEQNVHPEVTPEDLYCEPTALGSTPSDGTTDQYVVPELSRASLSHRTTDHFLAPELAVAAQSHRTPDQSLAPRPQAIPPCIASEPSSSSAYTISACESQPRLNHDSSSRRSRLLSWKALPQRMRGILLGELWDFYNTRQQWMEQLRWRCYSCNKSCDCTSCVQMPSGRTGRSTFWPGPKITNHGTCLGCGGTEGRMQMRNLHEVNDEMILPICIKQRVSYVEYLRRRQAHTAGRSLSGGMLEGRPVETFVSHWWGEEFPKFVCTLQRFAETNCAVWCRSPCRRTRDPRSWSFWICAFANNQYAIENATRGDSNDIMQSAFAIALQHAVDVLAVLDEDGRIYNRIWCAFELFFVKVILKERNMELVLANQNGVLSLGDADREDRDRLKQFISTVRIANAQASNQDDRQMILAEISKANATCEELDQILIELTRSCSVAIRIRECFFAFGVAVIPSSAACAAFHLMRQFLTAREYLWFGPEYGRAAPLLIGVCGACVCALATSVWCIIMFNLRNVMGRQRRLLLLRRSFVNCGVLTLLATIAMGTWAPVSLTLMHHQQTFWAFFLGTNLSLVGTFVTCYPVLRRWHLLPTLLRRWLEDPLFARSRRERLLYWRTSRSNSL